MLTRTVLTHADWLRVLEVWQAATSRFEMDCPWEILQIDDAGGMRKFTLKACAHADHESSEVMVQLRLTGTGEETETVWDASKRCVHLPSCAVKYIEETNSRSPGVTRFTPDDPMTVGAGL